MVDAAQRHPIMVSQQPATHEDRACRAARRAVRRPARAGRGFPRALSRHGQRQQPAGHRRAERLANESRRRCAPSATCASMISDYGFSEGTVAIEPYHGGRDGDAPDPPLLPALRRRGAGVRRTGRPISPTTARNLPYANFGCAQQRNLAAQIANPADLLGPRTMAPRGCGAARGRDRQVSPGQDDGAPRRAPTSVSQVNGRINRGRAA